MPSQSLSTSPPENDAFSQHEAQIDEGKGNNEHKMIQEVLKKTLA
jgi:hypothetical protein